MADRCAALPNVARVDVLPFHRLGRSKYDRLGIEFPLDGTPVPTPDEVAGARAIFAARRLSVA